MKSKTTPSRNSAKSAAKNSKSHSNSKGRSCSHHSYNDSNSVSNSNNASNSYGHNDTNSVNKINSNVNSVAKKTIKKHTAISPEEEQEDKIHKALLQQPVDVETLRSYSRLPNGYLNRQTRAQVWPKLLGINRYNLLECSTEIIPHRDYEQVVCDVERSLWSFECTKKWSDGYREQARDSLTKIILSVLARNDGLYYYQGYHDLVSVFLLVLQESNLTFTMVEEVTKRFFADYMRKDFEITSKFMRILLVIIKASDRVLHQFLVSADVVPFFATAWLLTWFSHVVKTEQEASRIFDVMLASHPLYCYYLCAAYVISIRVMILESECDFATIHNVIVKSLERNNNYNFPIERLIRLADTLLQQVPIDSLPMKCDRELHWLIRTNRIVIFSKFTNDVATLDADWYLLQQHMQSKPFTDTRKVFTRKRQLTNYDKSLIGKDNSVNKGNRYSVCSYCSIDSLQCVFHSLRNSWPFQRNKADKAQSGQHLLFISTNTLVLSVVSCIISGCVGYYYYYRTQS